MIEALQPAETVTPHAEVTNENLASKIDGCVSRFGKGLEARTQKIESIPHQVEKVKKSAGLANGNFAAEVAAAAVPGGVLLPEPK